MWYNVEMNNHWSVDIQEFKKKDKDAFTIWDLEQRVNWDIGEGKISKKDLLKYWNRIDIDVFKRKALSLALF